MLPKRETRGGGPKTRIQSEATRQKIKATLLVLRLQDHAMGKIELSVSQVRAIGILLRKVVPDLISTEMVADIVHHYVAEIPPVLSKQEWLEKYGNGPAAEQELPAWAPSKWTQ